MTAPAPVIALVREWIAKAENDLTTAVHTLRLGSECPTDTVCFHAQQCVEKYIKALLVFLACEGLEVTAVVEDRDGERRARGFARLAERGLYDRGRLLQCDPGHAGLLVFSRR